MKEKKDKKEWDFKKELIRKAIHLFSVSFLIIYVVTAKTVNPKVGLFVLSFMLVILFDLEYVRMELGAKIPVLKYLYEYRRKREENYMGGEIFFLMGSIISLAIFEPYIAAAGILMTTFGDMAAAVIGTRFGKTPVPLVKGKCVEGVFAELIVNLIIGFLVLRIPINGKMWWDHSWLPSGEPIWILIIVMSLTATIVETAAKKMDDNLLIPVIAGFNGQVVFLLLKGSF